MRGDVRRAAALVALVALVASAAASAQTLSLQVVVAPPFVQLGVDGTALIEIRGPADMEAPWVTVSAGRADPALRVGAGHYTAAYVPPGQRYPQVAIVAATAKVPRGVAHGWTALPLWGQGDAVVKTRAFAEVTVRIGPRTYGPIKADAAGLGTVPVVVPPGEGKAFYGTREIDLGLPAVPLLHLSLGAREVAGDHTNTVAVRAYSVTAQGQPRADLPLKFSATVGQVSAARAAGPGVTEADWTLPPGPPATAELSVWSPAERSSTSVARLAVLPGPPAKLSVSVTPQRLVAGASGKVQVRVGQADARGYATASPVRVGASLGEAGAAAAQGPGETLTIVAVPDDFRHQRVLRLDVEVEGGPSAHAEVELAPGPVQSIRIEPARAEIRGDGASEVSVKLTAVDAFGNVAPDAEPRVTVGQGTVRLSKTAPGEFTVGYTAPELARRDAAALEVVAGEASAHADFDVTPNQPRLTASPKAGWLTNLGNVSALSASVEGGLWTRGRDSQFGALLEGGYLPMAQTATLATGPVAGRPIRGSFHFVPVLASVAWRAALSDPLWFRAAAGGGVLAVSSSLAIDGLPEVREGAVVPAAHLSLAIGLRWLKGGPFAEARLWGCGDPHMNNLNGDLLAVSLSLGYRFDAL